MIEKILMAIVMSVLQFLAQRKDLKDAAKAEVYRELWDRSRKAYEWEQGAVATHDGGATLRVRDGAPPLQLHRDDSGADRSPLPPHV